MSFQSIYAQRPDKAEVGSSGYSNLKHLWNIVRSLSPPVIIESGAWKGNSSWVLKNASTAPVISYDINLSNLMRKTEGVMYIECDIEHDIDFHFDPDALLFFDDHINQEQRLKYAYETGFRYLIFDDNVTAGEAMTLKNPASPTLDMINAKELPFVEEYEVLKNLRPKERDTRLTWVKLIL